MPLIPILSKSTFMILISTNTESTTVELTHYGSFVLWWPTGRSVWCCQIQTSLKPFFCNTHVTCCYASYRQEKVCIAIFYLVIPGNYYKIPKYWYSLILTFNTFTGRYYFEPNNNRLDNDFQAINKNHWNLVDNYCYSCPPIAVAVALFFLTCVSQSYIADYSCGCQTQTYSGPKFKSQTKLLANIDICWKIFLQL